MAWSTNDIMNALKFFIRKNQAGGIRAIDLFYAWNTEQAMYHADLLGRWQNRNNGKSGANTGLIQNETVITELTPFIFPATIPIVAGSVTKPTGFAYTLDLRINGRKVFPIRHDQTDEVNNSVIDPPSVADNTYYYKEYQNAYSILPSTVTGNSSLDYIKACTDIVWAFTLDTDGRQVYSAAGGVSVTPTTGSVQPLWLQDDIITITKRVLTNFGVSFKDADFTNFGRTAQATGD